MEKITRALYLPFLPYAPGHTETVLDTARSEAEQGRAALGLDQEIALELREELGESYEIQCGSGYSVIGGNPGILYGVYDLLMDLFLGREPWQGIQKPDIRWRMLNCWDNLDGSIERGYSGRSLWFDHGELCYDKDRIRQLGRLLASAGINTICINNVNVHEREHELIGALLEDVAALADILRSFGIRMLISVDFAHPLLDGVGSADPLDAEVEHWWSRKVDQVYAAIPDLAGFVIKADSEGRPGPFSYGRSHAEGANMIARQMRRHGGIVVWRCFVYNCRQDWRDTSIDRPKAAYEHYQPLDGLFDDNVILQVKNGPFDFQVREPISPLLLSMQHTNLGLEMQLAQEYTGQQRDIYAMPGLFRETLNMLSETELSAMAAVSNLGNDSNYTGHPFAALNLYAFGQFSWNREASPEGVAADWIRLTYPELSRGSQGLLLNILLSSREIYEKYTSNLGLCWMVTPNSHYGPSPDGYEYQMWGTYHRADRNAVGIDRTRKGTGYTAQYPQDLADLYDNIETCPERLLLFFHRMNYTDEMRDGRTLIQRLYDDHFSGLAMAQSMAHALEKMNLPEPDRSEVLARMEMQLDNAEEWCDVLNSFFFRLSGIADADDRTIYR